MCPAADFALEMIVNTLICQQPVTDTNSQTYLNILISSWPEISEKKQDDAVSAEGNTRPKQTRKQIIADMSASTE